MAAAAPNSSQTIVNSLLNATKTTKAFEAKTTDLHPASLPANLPDILHMIQIGMNRI